MNPAQPLLALERCTIRFGGLTAVCELDLTVGERELVGLIGPNGAGKTTAFNLITGVYRPTEGRIVFNGRSITGRRPCQITAHGIARTFQNIRLFPSLSVFDNVRVSFHLHVLSGIEHALWRGRAFHEEETDIARRVLELLALFRLDRFREMRSPRYCGAIGSRASVPAGSPSSASSRRKRRALVIPWSTWNESSMSGSLM